MLLTVPLQLQLIPVISSEFNPSCEVGLAVDRHNLNVQLPLLGNQNLFIDSHVNFSSEPVLLFACKAMEGLVLRFVTQESLRMFNHD